MACQCYAHLPCLGGVLDRGAGAGRAEGWTNQIHCLLASANSHLALIYQGAEMGMLALFCCMLGLIKIHFHFLLILRLLLLFEPPYFFLLFQDLKLW